MRLNSPHFQAKIIVSLADRDKAVDKVLGYALEFNYDGIFSMHKGRRALMLERLHMNKSQYVKAIASLVRLGLLKKLRNEQGGKYVFYELTEKCQVLREKARMIKLA